MLFSRSRRGFTLIELLIVIAIIGVLSSILLTALSSVRRKTQITVASSHINAIKAALAAYETDMGRYPRLSLIPTTGDEGTASKFPDDAPGLYAALRNLPGRGGGPNSPYLQDWKAEDVGVYSPRGTYCNAEGAVFENKMGQASANAFNFVKKLGATEVDAMNTMAFQNTHNPGVGGGDPLVLLDPWGNPFHYREWGSVRKSIKFNITASATAPVSYTDESNNPGAPVITLSTPQIRARSPETFDIWSNGPNGVNEMGDPDSDDVTSWR